MPREKMNFCHREELRRLEEEEEEEAVIPRVAEEAVGMRIPSQKRDHLQCTKTKAWREHNRIEALGVMTASLVPVEAVVDLTILSKRIVEEHEVPRKCQTDQVASEE